MTPDKERRGPAAPTPKTELQRRARILWKHEGHPYRAAREALGYGHERSVDQVARAMGFRKLAGTYKYLQGPCVECLVVYGKERLCKERTCAACRAPEVEVRKNPSGWRPMVDMEHERREHRKRMRQRDRGERPRLPKPCVLRNAAGWPIGGARPV